jgi:FAD/FMN-containing dehydrogenase
MPGGNLGSGVVVDLSAHFTAMGAPEPVRPCGAGEARINVQAGVRGAAVEEAARGSGFTFPPLPSSARWCTVGGMAANNSAGARSFRYGAMERWVVGLEGVDAWGSPFRITLDPAQGSPPRSGGSRLEAHFAALGLRLPVGADRLPLPWPSVRKNASGYRLDRALDLHHPLPLLIGSEGTLALITGMTLRLVPMPPSRGVHLLPVRTLEELEAVAHRAVEMGASACEFLGRRFLTLAQWADHPNVEALVPGAEALVLLEFDGEPEEVESGLRDAAALGRNLSGAGVGSRDPQLAQDLWGIRHAASPTIALSAQEGLHSTQFIEDCVVPPSRLGAYLRGLDEILSRQGLDAVVFGHAGDANVHVNPLIDPRSPGWKDRVRDTLEAVVDLVAALGGTLTGEHGDGRLRAPYLHRIWGDARAQVFQRVKSHFDPEGILNPGVILPLKGQDPLHGLSPRAHPWPDPAADLPLSPLGPPATG